MDPTQRPRVSLTLALVVVSWSAWVVFQTTQLVSERTNLERLKVGQESAFQQSVKTRAEIDSIANDIARLAAQGNSGAQLIVTELQKRGIKIDPSKKTVPPGAN
jgi:hypothetical protein